ncbi:DUF1338 domain-containing protein [Flavobacterium granuli]|uniref:2-oxoadipate dioxygenase/decarboxylase n=1 Tax=Flavobacterium granuli TaxID=280093 RepID=A0A1M5N4J7_9FLAO|nr:DUF1338 domain-containing protein [Flavobacterium granuli]PRZ25189.1 uncharacterized protein DUF1338 [Flavobacterium granuli]SHG84494.1 protein of unknown function [Flavobacterium granuli]
MNKDLLLSRLWEQYKSITPSAQKIHALLEQNGETIKNDHIAIRTYNDARVNISVLEKPFVKAGYVAKGEYFFESKKLFAKHYEHATDANAPRIFISELELEKCSEDLQNSVKTLLDGCDQSVFEKEDLVLSGAVWNANSYDTYVSLLEESEYAAWMYVYGFRANHFTINVNALTDFENLEELNAYLKDNNWKMNASGGEIKGTPEQLLEQSSTLADLYAVTFDEGVKYIPSCYYEFALRYPMLNGELYQGFIAASADKIFESTDVKLQRMN